MRQVRVFGAMLCISSIDAVVQRLSVRPSVTFVYSVETSAHISEFFLLSASHTSRSLCGGTRTEVPTWENPT